MNERLSEAVEHASSELREQRLANMKLDDVLARLRGAPDERVMIRRDDLVLLVEAARAHITSTAYYSRFTRDFHRDLRVAETLP